MLKRAGFGRRSALILLEYHLSHNQISAINIDNSSICTIIRIRYNFITRLPLKVLLFMPNVCERFSTALAKRSVLNEKYESLRLVDGIADGLPGLYLDKFGSVAVAQVHFRSDDEIDLDFLNSEEILKLLKIESLFLRRRFLDSSKSYDEPAQLLQGKDVDEIIFAEHGLSYHAYPKKLVNAGFFIDMREVRRSLIEIPGSKRALNLFCYTGSLGIACAAAGFAEVVQVDVSKSILSLAKANFELNLLNLKSNMRFIQDDTDSYLVKEERRIAKGHHPFELIIVDPPSFARFDKRTFQLDRDLEGLLDKILKVSAPSARIIFTCNYRKLRSRDIWDRVRAHLKYAGKKADLLSLVEPPPDFTSHGYDSIAVRGVDFILKS